MTVAAIHQPQYLPYLGFFHKVRHADVLVVLDNVEYLRRGLQNRNKIKTSQGVQWLTVPVIQRSGQQIREVMTNPSVEWRSQHWNALRLNYGPAPHFEEYGAALKEQLLGSEEPSLCVVNMILIKWVMELLGIETSIVLASEQPVEGQSSERLVNLCRAVGARDYLSGPGGTRYMDLDVFRRGGVNVLWQEFESPVYDQRWPKLGFVPDLSVVDSLFCWGEGVRGWLGT